MRLPSINYGTHLPALIKAVSVSYGPILELGMGLYSTPFLHWACYQDKRPLVSLETDQEYCQAFKVFETDYHQIKFVEHWDKADLSGHWGVVLVDHHPDSRRKEEVIRLADAADYLVLHDTNPRCDHKYKFSEIYHLFKYRKDYWTVKPYTTILSNSKDLAKL